jgi:chromosome segregation ATPase
LITKSEDMLKNVIHEKENLKLEKEENLTELSFKINDLQQENLNLNNKINTLMNDLLKKEEEIRQKDEMVKAIEMLDSPKNDGQEEVSNALMEDLKGELTKRKNQITTLEERIKDLELENITLNNQLIETMHDKPIDYVVEMDTSKNAYKPVPSKNSSIPLETLCQDLQTDLNKYKRIVEKLNEEKSQLKTALEEKGFQFEAEDLEKLKNENEVLKQDLESIQKTIKNKEVEISHVAMRQVEDKIKELENKIKDKEAIIADLKLSQPSQMLDSKSSMARLVEDLQNQINKLKIVVKEKDQQIAELSK